MMVPFLRGIRGMKMYTGAIWHAWKNHFEFVFPRRKTEVPLAGLFIAVVPNRCADAADYPSRLVGGALRPRGERGGGGAVYAEMYFNCLLSACFGGT